ncbi:pentatricopeptide repeat (PPR) superfamily protein [Tasmannia lanceolata]|uniref:pentatricopeptide repeat (PPR) superfamily protein n=1 Tax=Tasmannia lanceolata TaxID=3420 RepID=UPI00406409A4
MLITRPTATAARVRLRVFLSKTILITSPFSTLPPPFLPPPPPSSRILDLDPKLVASFFKEWFKSSKTHTIFHIISKILSSHPQPESALSQLGLRLSEEFVLKVLSHQNDVLPSLKFFDWAGRQPGYHHTRATYHSIFKILSRAKLMTVMVDWLEAFSIQRNAYPVRFHDILVLGYAVAGKSDVALQLFGKMRFQGLDLDSFTYHVLLNSLVEERCFDIVDVILKQVAMRGLSNAMTPCIRMKSLCKQSRLDEAEAFIRELDLGGEGISGHMVSMLVDALCKDEKFEEAKRFVEEFGKLGKVPMSRTYSIWISDLIEAGKIDGAMDFLQIKKAEGYVPAIFCYNKLICSLLRGNRLDEVYDLLMEMREEKILPDRLTMNAVLCFFCKAGMVEVALQLYNLRYEIKLSLNRLAYNHLINALCGDGSIDEACRVLDDSLKQGYFPGKRAFYILADALCREGKLDKMSKLVDAALQRSITPSSAICAKYMSALCKAGRADEAYSIPVKLNKTNHVLHRPAYFHLIRGFSELRRGDMALRLLLEMQDSGHSPTRNLYRAVVCCLCETGNMEQVLNLLDLQLLRQEPDRRICNYLIDGAGHAGKPDLGKEVLERMTARGIKPNIDTKYLMLKSYLRSKRFADALNFYNDMCKENEPSTRLYNIMIVGLCIAKKTDLALDFWREVREKELIPSLHCYEELIHSLCLAGDFDMVVKILNDFEKSGRRISSFICNVLLLYTLKSRQLNRAWIQSGNGDVKALDSLNLKLSQLISAFSGGIRVKQNLDNLEEVVEQWFPADIYTYNMLLKGLTMEGRMDCACDLFNRICNQGHKPNRFTYDIIIHGFCKWRRTKDAERWMEEMYQKGFYPTWCTISLFNNIASNG